MPLFPLSFLWEQPYQWSGGPDLKYLDVRGLVVAHGQVGPGTHILGIRAPEIRKGAKPGQFCMIDLKPPGAIDPLLRRPLSIHRVGPKGLLIFMYKVVGRGTALLSQLSPGGSLRILGPLGNGFRIDQSRPGLLIGGGIGTAPLVFLSEAWPKDVEQVAIIGGRTRADIEYAARCLEDTPSRVHLATDDGSLGHKGPVTDLMSRAMEMFEGRSPVVYSCGPGPMLKAVARMAADFNLECQVSLEARMACGMGLCLGCAVPGSMGDDSADSGYLHVCREGPVFRADQVSWEDYPCP